MEQKVETPETKIEEATVEAAVPQKDDSTVISPDLEFVNEIIKGRRRVFKKVLPVRDMLCRLQPDTCRQSFPEKRDDTCPMGIEGKTHRVILIYGSAISAATALLIVREGQNREKS